MFMLDVKLIRENPEIVKENQKKRGLDVKIVDDFILLDKKWRELKKEVDKLRWERNKISEEINQAKKNKDEEKAAELIKKKKIKIKKKKRNK